MRRPFSLQTAWTGIWRSLVLPIAPIFGPNSPPSQGPAFKLTSSFLQHNGFVSARAMPDRLILLLFLPLVLSTNAFAQTINETGPSFPCGGNLLPTEAVICSDDNLASLDRQLATVYRNKLRELSQDQQAELQTAQKTWVAQRNQCRTNKSCIINAYQSRISLLGSPPYSIVDSKVHINDLPAEAGRIAKHVTAECKDTGDTVGDIEDTIDVYQTAKGKRLALFDPKRICAFKGNSVCSTDGCDIYIYSEQSPGVWTTALKQTVTGDITVEQGDRSAPLQAVINVRGNVPPCNRNRQSTCIFELTWRGAGFSWKRLR
jgi:uncharacterized protein